MQNSHWDKLCIFDVNPSCNELFLWVHTHHCKIFTRTVVSLNENYLVKSRLQHRRSPPTARQLEEAILPSPWASPRQMIWIDVSRVVCCPSAMYTHQFARPSKGWQMKIVVRWRRLLSEPSFLFRLAALSRDNASRRESFPSWCHFLVVTFIPGYLI